MQPEIADPFLYFDRQDHVLLGIVRDVLERRDVPSLRRIIAPYLHPHGIKEMAAPRGLRIAYSVVRLLGLFEIGDVDDRLTALRAVRDEILTATDTNLPRNTARVLVAIMKELVRTPGDTPSGRLAQLKLARDFREAANGRPRFIRAQLARHHLPEMPEEWNQIAFDDHVHDANTKGRKSATHLVMDAWIKGLRRLMVIYYNHVRPEFADELLEAASIMGIEVRIGIELSCPFRGRFARLIWSPSGLTEPQQFADFLAKPAVAAFMAKGREVSLYRRRYVEAALAAFNDLHRPRLNQVFGLDLPPLPLEEFTAFVGMGQASLLHLGKFIHTRLLPLLQARAAVLGQGIEELPEAERAARHALFAELDVLDVETIIDRFLVPARNPGLPDPDLPQPDAPYLLTLPPGEMAEKVAALTPGHTLALTLTGLLVPDVIEILYDCRGRITHLEVLNVKDSALGRAPDLARVMELSDALDTQNVILLKRRIRDILDARAASDDPGTADQTAKLEAILCDIVTFKSLYRRSPLKSRIGSDSTGSSCRLPGMGLAVLDTLPGRARRELTARGHALPLVIDANPRVTSSCPGEDDRPGAATGLSGRLCRAWPALRPILAGKSRDWVVRGYRFAEGRPGNVYLLGGVREECGNGLPLPGKARARREERSRRLPPRYLKTPLRNALKILTGFVPAFLTFFLTKDWWLLAWFGAVIWFAITGFRNIIQSVLGAGGVHRSHLLRWNDLVSWSRLSDSLLYTGFSVPLLDWLVKTLLLDRGFGITTTTNPLALYTVMGLANGLYLTSHNLYRGLPRAAAFGNFFRSVLSIPIAFGLNALLAAMLGSAGLPAAVILQKWAAVISKLASDTVAGVIEGLADRARNLRLRRQDYEEKLDQLFSAYEQLELLYPRQDALDLLESPKKLIRKLSAEGKELLTIVIVNALDLLYLWMYQPRARSELTRRMRLMSQDERRAFLLSQYVLLRERDISQMFLDGLVGKNFSRALSFYLDNARRYLEKVQRLAGKLALKESGAPGANGPGIAGLYGGLPPLVPPEFSPGTTPPPGPMPPDQSRLAASPPSKSNTR